MSLLPWYVHAIAGSLATLAVCWMLHSIDVNRLEKSWTKQESDAVEKQAKQCDNSKQPKKEADHVSENNTAHLLDTCLGKLQHAPKCIPVHISRPASSAPAACEQPASGVTDTAIMAANIGCQKDRDDLNAAKIWGQGYDKFVKERQ